MKKEVLIGDRPVGEAHRAFIVAELSANHGGKLETAVETIRAAKKAGADAIKLQTYTADTLTIDCKNEYFTINEGTLWDGRNLYELYQEAYTPWEWHAALFEAARREGLVCFSSPFDFTAVDFLEKLNAPAYKIASFEIVDIPLIEYAASKMKPIIMSTGIATLNNIKEAVDACLKVGNDQIILLKCTSQYPAPLEEANLLTIPDMKKRFSVIPGLSDHTMGFIGPVCAVALGAKFIEKHFILDRSVGGPDASFSLTPAEFSEMVSQVRNAESALGEVTYDLSDKVKKSVKFARSLFVVEDIRKGEAITPQNVRSIRPSFGLHPRHYQEVLGKKAKTDMKKGTPLQFDLID